MVGYMGDELSTVNKAASIKEELDIQKGDKKI
jgi:hypothetical protein